MPSIHLVCVCVRVLYKLIIQAYVQVDLSDFVLFEFSEAQLSIDMIKELLLFRRNLNIR